MLVTIITIMLCDQHHHHHASDHHHHHSGGHHARDHPHYYVDVPSTTLYSMTCLSSVCRPAIHWSSRSMKTSPVGFLARLPNLGSFRDSISSMWICLHKKLLSVISKPPPLSPYFLNVRYLCKRRLFLEWLFPAGWADVFPSFLCKNKNHN